MDLLAFFAGLGDSSWSVSLHESQYAYAIIESVHVWTMAVFFGSIIMVDLRLLGLTMRKVPVTEVAGRLLPWTVGAFVLMVVTGSLLFSAIPLRSYQNIFFRTKMLLLLAAGLNVWLFPSGIYRKSFLWGLHAIPPKRAKLSGALSLTFLACITVSGRMIPDKF